MADWFESNSAGDPAAKQAGSPRAGVPRHRPPRPGRNPAGGLPRLPTRRREARPLLAETVRTRPIPLAVRRDTSSAQSPSGGWQAAAAPRPPSYNPYGWQPPAYTPAPMPGNSSKPPKKEKERPWHPHRCTGRAVRGDHHRAVRPARPSLGRRNQSFGRWRQQHGRREPCVVFPQRRRPQNPDQRTR